MRPLHLYCVVMRYRDAGIITAHVLSTSKQDAIRRVRERTEFTARDGTRVRATLYECERVDTIGDYEIMLRRKTTEVKVS